MLTLFKHKNRIICYVRQISETKFTTCTGKPSDVSCISWNYDNKQDALFTANEFLNNYINK